jgi:hypothetical protein
LPRERRERDLDTLAAEAVRVLDWSFNSATGQQRWAKVSTPSGREGFIDGGLVRTFGEERLCARRDAAERWVLSGYIGGGD